ncbi:Zinc finger BED domain-containing protein RICESLEEPER 2 [Bienertia sinuspersici]
MAASYFLCFYFCFLLGWNEITIQSLTLMLLKLHHPQACKTKSWRQLGQPPPSTPVLGQLEVAEKVRTDSSSDEWKIRAAVWDHFSFTKLSDVKGEYEANCKYCNNTHYKGDYSPLLAIAFVLDPWYKMVLVRLMFSKLYVPIEVEARVKEIYDALVELYKFYHTSPTSSLVQSSHNLVSSCVSIGDAQSNVDAYLKTPLMARNSETPFDILEYWKSQSVSFRVMSCITKDVLPVSITSVAAKSSFSIGGRVLTKYRSSLRTDNVEAFDQEVVECFEVMNDVMLDDVDHDSLTREDA